MSDDLVLQSAEMRIRGIGWKADPCTDPPSCDEALCVADTDSRHWHPVDPLEFAKWRVRTDLDNIPAHVLVRLGRGWQRRMTFPATVRQGLALGALGLISMLVAVVWWHWHEPDTARA